VFNKFIKYIREVRQEMSKVIWPSRGELRDSSVVVVILSLLMAVFIFSIDQVLNLILKIIL